MTDHEQRARVVDRDALFRASVVGRGVIYLDTAVWGELADDTPESAARVKRYASLVENGSLVFPSSWPSAFEALRNPHDAHRVRQLKAMDRLGRMVSFRQTLEVEREEALWALPGILGTEQAPPGRERVYTHVVEMLGAADIVFPPGWNERGTTFFMDKIREELSSYGLERLGSAMDLSKLRARHVAETETRMRERRGEAASRRNAAMFRRGDGKLDRKRILLEEQLYFVKRTVKQVAATVAGAVPAAELPGILDRMEHSRADPLGVESLFRLMPSTALRAEVFAYRVCEAGRREQPGDFYDNVHGSVAPGYSDAFVSGDRNLIRLLRACRTPQERGCAVLLGLDELDEFLRRYGGGPD